MTKRLFFLLLLFGSAHVGICQQRIYETLDSIFNNHAIKYSNSIITLNGHLPIVPFGTIEYSNGSEFNRVFWFKNVKGFSLFREYDWQLLMSIPDTAIVQIHLCVASPVVAKNAIFFDTMMMSGKFRMFDLGLKDTPSQMRIQITLLKNGFYKITTPSCVSEYQSSQSNNKKNRRRVDRKEKRIYRPPIGPSVW